MFLFSYLSILPDDNADIRAGCHFSFSFLNVLSIFMITLYILSNRFLLKSKRSSKYKIGVFN